MHACGVRYDHSLQYKGRCGIMSLFVRIRSAPRGVAGGVNPLKALMH